MPFNDEGLARAISACPVPVVTGIGHEPDTTIADMVSDYRASTPTQAALAVSPDSAELNSLVDTLLSRMDKSLVNRLNRSVEYLDAMASRPVLRDPASMYELTLACLIFIKMYSYVRLSIDSMYSYVRLSIDDVR